MKHLLTLIAALSQLVAARAGAVPTIEHWQTSNGAQVYFVPAPELPMVDVRVVFAAGAARDGEQGGLAAMTAGLLKEGAGDLDADAFASRLAATGAIIGAGAERDMGYVSLRSLVDATTLDPAVALFADVLARPRFDQPAFDRRKARALIGLKRKEQSPEALMDDAFFASVYPDHPYGRPPSGTQASIGALTVADVRAFHTKYYVAANATVAIVGALDRAGAAALAERIVKALPAGERAPALPPVPAAPAREQHVEFPSIQSHVRVGLAAVTRDDPDYIALLVGNHALGGNPLVSILFDEVRNKRGLSYSVASWFAPMAQPGPFVAALQTDRRQQDEALKVLRATIARFVEEGPPAAAIDAAKQNLVDGFPLRVSNNGQIVEYLAMIGFYALPLDYLERVPRAIATVTPADVKAAFARHVQPDRLHTVVVGRSAADTTAAVPPAGPTPGGPPADVH